MLPVFWNALRRWLAFGGAWPALIFGAAEWLADAPHLTESPLSPDTLGRTGWEEEEPVSTSITAPCATWTLLSLGKAREVAAPAGTLRVLVEERLQSPHDTCMRGTPVDRRNRSLIGVIVLLI